MVNRLYIIGGGIVAVLLMLLYISHLKSSLSTMETERDEYKNQAETVSNYLTSYEPKKQANDLNYEGWVSDAEKIEVRENCVKSVPVGVREFIGRL